MTISAQLKLIREGFAEWERSNGGKAVIVDSLDDLITLLRTAPASPRVYCMWHTETKRGEHEEAGVVDREFWIVLTRQTAQTINPGDGLVRPAGGGKAFYDLYEEAREVCRRLSFDSETTEVSINFITGQPFELNGTTLTDATRIQFLIGTALPGVDETRNPTDPNPETANT